MRFSCCDERRRNAVRQHPTLNGIDYLDVPEDSTLPEGQRLRTLLVYCIKPFAGDVPNSEQVKILGGERIRDIVVTQVSIGEGEQAGVLQVQVNQPGDFSVYQLQLAFDTKKFRFDPLLTSVDFTFRIETLSDFDCSASQAVPPPSGESFEINYIAKDYTSFRQLMLDRLAVLVPQWKERSPADLEVMLVELLAYVADYLSYQQDVIATESYLSTARRRISVRRHARLLDYTLGEGSNARTWMHIDVNTNIVETKNTDGTKKPALSQGVQFFTQLNNLDAPVLIPPTSFLYNQALSQQPTVFETVYAIDTLYKQHNQMNFYTWGAQNCCLPQGTTAATLAGHFDHLQVGDILIFKELIDPQTGQSIDADITHRCAVRLTKVHYDVDPLGRLFQQSILNTIEQGNETTVNTEEDEEMDDDEDTDEETEFAELDDKDTVDENTEALEKTGETAQQDEVASESEPEDETGETDYSLPVTEIEWSEEDALPFPLYISATTDAEHGARFIETVSIALGNNILADHGRTIVAESLGAVVPSPNTKLFKAPLQQGGDCQQSAATIPVRPRFYPSLRQTPLTYSGPAVTQYSPESATATTHWATVRPDITALPAIELTGTLQDGNILHWRPMRDLLQVTPTTPAFVVEVESNGTAYLRFGDDRHGMFPESQTSFTATYRVGNGTQGNVGVDSLLHIVSDDPRIESVTNPLPALGSSDPESIDNVKQRASSAFLAQQEVANPHFVQRRMVTLEDCIKLVKQDPAVSRVNAVRRWTGSWHTTFLAVERTNGRPLDHSFRSRIYSRLENYRLLGSDIEIVAPIYVSLEIAMTVSIKDDFFRNSVKARLLDVFSDRLLPTGEHGYFSRVSSSFGQSVSLSKLRAAAMAVPGVDAVAVTTFQRQGFPNERTLESGIIELDWMEIARLENDPNFQEHGIFHLSVEGGN